MKATNQHPFFKYGISCGTALLWKSLIFFAFAIPAKGAASYIQNEPSLSRKYSLTPQLGIYHLGGPSLGLMFSGRIVDRGFVPKLNNSVSLEGGVFSGLGWYEYWGSGLLFRMRWDFHLAPEWTVYGAAELGWWTRWNITSVNLPIGGMWHFSDSASLRFELNTFGWGSHPARIGVSFYL